MSSFFAPFLTLEGQFGTGFTGQSLADAILVAEQNESSVFEFGAFIVDGLEQGNLAFDVFRGLFLLSDPITGAIRAEAPTQQGLRDQIERVGLIGPPGLTGPPGPPGPAPEGTGVSGAEALRTLSAILDSLRRARDEPAFPAPVSFPTTGPPAPAPPAGPVRPGGTVNVPVVLGSTGDPTGVRRPTFPNEDQLTRAQQIGQIIRNLLALRKARQNADKQRRAFEQYLAARLEILRRAQMPFGQAGTFQLSAGGGVNGGRDFFGDLLSAAGGFLTQQFGRSQLVDPAQFPSAPPPGLPGLQGGPAFAGACPPLFRGGTMPMRVSPVPWFPVQAPNGKWFFFGHLGTPTFSRLKARRRHHHHSRKR